MLNFLRAKKKQINNGNVSTICALIDLIRQSGKVANEITLCDSVYDDVSAFFSLRRLNNKLVNTLGGIPVKKVPDIKVTFK